MLKHEIVILINICVSDSTVIHMSVTQSTIQFELMLIRLNLCFIRLLWENLPKFEVCAIFRITLKDQ